VAYDLRGHGMSEAPLDPEHYADGKLWADDVAGMIETLQLDRPVLVGWSYGGFIACDYVRAYGQDRISAINLAGGATTLAESAFGTLIGPGFLEHLPGAVADDLPTNIAAMRGLVKAFSAKPLPPEDVETLLAAGMVVPARIRANLAAREIDGDDVLRALHLPMLPPCSWPGPRTGRRAVVRGHGHERAGVLCGDAPEHHGSLAEAEIQAPPSRGSRTSSGDWRSTNRNKPLIDAEWRGRAGRRTGAGSAQGGASARPVHLRSPAYFVAIRSASAPVEGMGWPFLRSM
jgi:pimeloyl-ACP methyl ester carboxylesterase